MKISPCDKITQEFACKPLRELTCLPKGLSGGQMEVQREQYGRNHAPYRMGDPLSRRIRRAFLNPFSVVLLVLAGISLLVDVVLVKPSEKNFTTVLIITVMLVISGCIRLTQELKSKRVTDRLIRLVDAPVSVFRNGSWNKYEAEELVVGDYIRVFAGERVPADIRIMRLESCFFLKPVLPGKAIQLPSLWRRWTRFLSGSGISGISPSAAPRWSAAALRELLPLSEAVRFTASLCRKPRTGNWVLTGGPIPLPGY